MGEEKRQSERHRVRFKLVYDDGNTFNAGSVWDVSEGGLFLETALPLPVGTEVSLTPLDATSDVLFEVRAKVVRAVEYDATSGQRSGMGLEFLELSSEERKNVVSMIRQLEEAASHASGEKDPFLGVVMPSGATGPTDSES